MVQGVSKSPGKFRGMQPHFFNFFGYKTISRNLSDSESKSLNSWKLIAMQSIHFEGRMILHGGSFNQIILQHGLLTDIQF